MLALLPLTFGVSSCDVHEFPELPEKRPYEVELVFDFESMFDWKMLYDDFVSNNQNTRGEVMEGTMRYIIRLYPRHQSSRTMPQCAQEFVLYRPVYERYGQKFTLDLIPGEYNMMIWADFVNPKTSKQSFFYNADDFSEIELSDHVGNTDYRDAFRGYQEVNIASDIEDKEVGNIIVEMKRPLAKFEFVSNDLKDFIDKEYLLLSKEQETKAPNNANAIDFNKYKVKFFYNGFMPDTYSMTTDKPIDSSTGRSVESSLLRLNEDEASLGFDYVFVNGKSSSVSVQVGIYNEKQEIISLSNPIHVPLLRGHHTIVRGSYLMQSSSEGVIINPEFEGEFNFIIP